MLYTSLMYWERKINDTTVQAIRDGIQQGLSTYKLAKIAGVSRSTIYYYRRKLEQELNPKRHPSPPPGYLIPKIKPFKPKIKPIEPPADEPLDN